MDDENLADFLNNDSPHYSEDVNPEFSAFHVDDDIGSTNNQQKKQNKMKGFEAIPMDDFVDDNLPPQKPLNPGFMAIPMDDSPFPPSSSAQQHSSPKSESSRLLRPRTINKAFDTGSKIIAEALNQPNKLLNNSKNQKGRMGNNTHNQRKPKQTTNMQFFEHMETNNIHNTPKNSYNHNNGVLVNDNFIDFESDGSFQHGTPGFSELNTSLNPPMIPPIPKKHQTSREETIADISSSLSSNQLSAPESFQLFNKLPPIPIASTNQIPHTLNMQDLQQPNNALQQIPQGSHPNQNPLKVQFSANLKPRNKVHTTSPVSGKIINEAEDIEFYQSPRQFYHVKDPGTHSFNVEDQVEFVEQDYYSAENIYSNQPLSTSGAQTPSPRSIQSQNVTNFQQQNPYNNNNISSYNNQIQQQNLNSNQQQNLYNNNNQQNVMNTTQQQNSNMLQPRNVNQYSQQNVINNQQPEYNNFNINSAPQQTQTINDQQQSFNNFQQQNPNINQQPININQQPNSYNNMTQYQPQYFDPINSVELGIMHTFNRSINTFKRLFSNEFNSLFKSQNRHIFESIDFEEFSDNLTMEISEIIESPVQLYDINQQSLSRKIASSIDCETKQMTIGLREIDARNSGAIEIHYNELKRLRTEIEKLRVIVKECTDDILQEFEKERTDTIAMKEFNQSFIDDMEHRLRSLQLKKVELSTKSAHLDVERESLERSIKSLNQKKQTYELPKINYSPGTGVSYGDLIYAEGSKIRSILNNIKEEENENENTAVEEALRLLNEELDTVKREFITSQMYNRMYFAYTPSPARHSFQQDPVHKSSLGFNMTNFSDNKSEVIRHKKTTL